PVGVFRVTSRCRHRVATLTARAPRVAGAPGCRTTPNPRRRVSPPGGRVPMIPAAHGRPPRRDPMADDETPDEIFEDDPLVDDEVFDEPDDLDADDEVFDEIVDEDEEEEEEDEVAPAAAGKARKAAEDEEEDDDEEELDPDDVEADLDEILKDRIAAQDDEDEDEDE